MHYSTCTAMISSCNRFYTTMISSYNRLYTIMMDSYNKLCTIIMDSCNIVTFFYTPPSLTWNIRYFQLMKARNDSEAECMRMYGEFITKSEVCQKWEELYKELEAEVTFLEWKVTAEASSHQDEIEKLEFDWRDRIKALEDENAEQRRKAAWAESLLQGICHLANGKGRR